MSLQKFIRNIGIVIMLFMASIEIASAHGEDKLGPHKGFIQMPGAFHTEVVLSSNNSLKIYLLDIQWKNPTTSKSSVNVNLVSKNIKAKCSPKKDYFQCSFPKSVNLLKKDDLQVSAVRQGQVGSKSIYKLPLQLEKPKEVKEIKEIKEIDHQHMHH